MLQRIIVPVIALGLAGVTAMFAKNWIEENNKQAPVAVAAPKVEAKFKEVLVASGSIHIGAFVGPESFRWQKWPDVDVPETYLVKGSADRGDLESAVARQDFGAGDPVTAAGFVKPGDRGFLAAVLEPEMRALTVPVDEASSNAGLVFPGDRVDLILTQILSATSDDGKEIKRRVSETILEDVRVIAMGRRLNAAGSGEPAGGGKGNNQVRTATLELTPKGAEVVALIGEIGKLSLSLRSLAGRDKESTKPRAGAPTWDSDVSRVLSGSGTQTKLVVLRGSQKQQADVAAGSP